MDTKCQVTVESVREAHGRIQKLVHKTAVLSSETINAIASNGTYPRRLFFKCENFQKVGAFKFRGASNALSLLDHETRHAGVVTASSGNHGQALALAASKLGIPAYIVMPSNAPNVKKSAVRAYGGMITECEPVESERIRVSKEIQERTGATYIHPYDDDGIIAGQGTCALELMEQVDPQLDAVLVPVGGGGLLSGTAITVKGSSKGIRVFACEPAGAPDAHESFHSRGLVPVDSPRTCADGLLTSLSARTFQVMLHNVDHVFLVPEHDIIKAMKLVWTFMKIIVEPSSALPLAAVLYNTEFRQIENLDRLGIILTGGNVSFERAFDLFSKVDIDES